MKKIISAQLQTLPQAPGVYRFFNEEAELLYVGKAKNLKKRVGSYFQKTHTDLKTNILCEQVAHIEITVTHTEKEALLLEDQLIKTKQPRYNMLLKDDKTYPFVMLSHHQFPRLAGIRAKTLKEGDYYGPYPSMHAVRETIELLQKTFKLRTCENGFFKNRSRPCLLHQIERCTAPCVGLISEADYHESIVAVRLFLTAKSQELLKSLGVKMDQAAEALDFEKAAVLRDQIKSLRQLQEGQVVHTQLNANVDVISVAEENACFCVDILEIRGGRVLGDKTFFVMPKISETPESILQDFVEHYYFAGTVSQVPQELVLSHSIEFDEDLALFFKTAFGRAPKLNLNPGTIRKKWLDLSLLNAREALARYILEAGQVKHRLALLAQHLGQAIRHIECFDISHTQGEETVASCVVFDENGLNKKAYRRFNMVGIKPGDDYAAMRQVLQRRLSRLQKENQALPNLLLIDGGKGQLKQAIEVLQELNIENIQLIGVAKGPERKAGAEELWLPHQKLPIHLDPHDPAFHLIQQIRDEAHRFAITGHRKRRDAKRSSSNLETIPGIGAKRRSALLKFFGGWQEIKKANVDELQKAPSISPKLAEQIFAYFH